MLRDLTNMAAKSNGKKWHAHRATVFGAYHLHELINKGGLCEIWTATDEDGNHFAVRKMHCGKKSGLFRKSPEEKTFWNGCDILQKVHHHPYIIDYIEHGLIEKRPYMLMHYVEGANLKQLLRKKDSHLGEYLCNILIDTAEALDHCHDEGYMHLDFKPENVLVTANGHVRLCDFDLAQPLPKQPVKLDYNAGTVAYMSPEQMLNKPLDHRSDIYSFGVTAYELLTFRQPFDGTTPEEMLRNKLSPDTVIKPPRDYNGDVPIALQNIVMKCLQFDPNKRYIVTTQLVKELHRALYV